MGIFKAAVSSIKGSLADQWQEVIAAENMGADTIMSIGAPVRKDSRSQNKKGTSDVISNGSVIHVNQNQAMLLVDGGKIVDYSAEPGYFQVENSSAPSLFTGDLDKSIEDTFNRVKFGGTVSYMQKAYFINIQEIKSIQFGTINPINYFDNFYNAELYLRAHGTFSVRVVDPIKFFMEVVPRNAERYTSGEFQRAFLAEFLTALQSTIGKMSVDGKRISHIQAEGMELSKYMSSILDDEWEERRGVVIESVGIASISYDDNSKRLINIRSEGAMLGDASVREGYIQGSVARGIEKAGGNSSGAVNAFMGVNMASSAGGDFIRSASGANKSGEDKWQCSCGNLSTGKFCSSCGKAKQIPGAWTCKECGHVNTGKFCAECGEKNAAVCPECGKDITGGQKFCSQCGKKL